MDYANPVFPSTGTANPAFPSTGKAKPMLPLAGVANMGPTAHLSKAGPAAYGGSPYYHRPYGYGGIWTTTGVILVLFILLVIVSRAWCT